MEAIVITYLHSGKILSEEDEIFLKKSKELGLVLTPINISNELEEKDILEVQKSDLIFNNSGETFAINFIKLFEDMGKLTVESSDSFKDDEDKWRFYKKCLKNNIPAPLTILLSEDLEKAKVELTNFNHWPVIIKRVRGTWGEYVHKANDLNEAIETINKFWEKGNERLSIIAQEFIDSFSYRVTYVGNKIVQTAIKENNNWKCTGVYAKNFKKFEIDQELSEIVKNIMNTTDIKICGIDLLKKDNHWTVIEANAEPALDFFENEKEWIIEEILLLLKNLAIEERKKESLREKSLASIEKPQKVDSILIEIKNPNNIQFERPIEKIETSKN